jgi:phosphate-selective porin OprO and OprP
MNSGQLPRLVVAIAIIGSRPSHGVCEDLDAPDPSDVTRSKTYEYEHEYFSIRLGGGLLIDYARYDQDDDSERQIFLNPESGIRDLRGLASGRIIWPRLTYTVGLMLDVRPNDWRFRQTGLRIQIPELGGYLFLGRTKEGFSTNKFMVGYYGWFNERSAVNDAFIPILADGARWTASAFGGHLVYNVGAFADALSDDESFNKNDWQGAGRVVWLPLAGDESDVETDPTDTVLHLAGELRYAGANDGFLQYRSRPESFLAQEFAVDTGQFPASRSTIVGVEAYYVRGPFSSGLEYFFNQVSSEPTNDPFFHGGEIFAAYLFTGETHPYNKGGGYFDDVVPSETFFSGGPGAWELAVRLSYVDLDSELVSGGKFSRATALVNWYLTDTLRFEAAYGYGVLDRFGIEGGTHFFQTRIQLQVK